MKTFFDVENLPSEFGGKATLKYDHEEFSRLMAQDDVKTAKFWGFDENNSSTLWNAIQEKMTRCTRQLAEWALSSNSE